MRLFTPAWQSKNPEKRMKAVKQRTAISELLCISEKAKYEDVRQEALKVIAKDGDRNTALKALEKIIDQTIFKDVVLNYVSNRTFCEAAVEKITDQTVLKEVAQIEVSYDYSSFRIIAVKKITNQEALIEIAKTVKVSNVGEEAIKRINDQNALIEIAKTNPYHCGRSAMMRINDQNVFIKIATTNTWASFVREEAVRMITDQAVLKEVALKNSEASVCKVALERITNQAVLKELAFNALCGEVRSEAVEKVNDQAVLKEVTLKDSKVWIREKAYKRLTAPDQTLLLNIVKDNENNQRFREAAFEKFLLSSPDQTLLSDIVKNKNNEYEYYIRGAALKQLLLNVPDQTLLSDIVKNGFDQASRAEAFRKLTAPDQTLLIDIIVKNENGDNMRQDAINKLTDPSLLKHFKNNKHDWNGCKCKICGETRDVEHEWIFNDSWSETGDRHSFYFTQYKCKRCEKTKTESTSRWI